MLEGGILGLIHLGLCIWAVINIINSRSRDLAKVLWIMFVLFFPLIGLVVWFFAGPKSVK